MVVCTVVASGFAAARVPSGGPDVVGSLTADGAESATAGWAQPTTVLVRASQPRPAVVPARLEAKPTTVLAQSAPTRVSATAAPRATPRPVVRAAATPEPQPAPTPEATPAPKPQADQAAARPARGRTYSRDEVIAAIRANWQGDDDKAVAVADCESALDPRAASPDETYLGLWQFKIQTWRDYGGSGDPRDHPPGAQTAVAWRVFGDQGWEAWGGCAP